MGEIIKDIKDSKDSIVRWLSIILTLLFYWFGVVKSNENTRVEGSTSHSEFLTMKGYYGIRVSSIYGVQKPINGGLTWTTII